MAMSKFAAMLSAKFQNDSATDEEVMGTWGFAKSDFRFNMFQRNILNFKYPSFLTQTETFFCNNMKDAKGLGKQWRIPSQCQWRWRR